MAKFSRFLHHARKCLSDVKEGHSSLLDWIAFLACLGIVATPWITRFFQPESKEWHSLIGLISRNAWHASVGGLILIGCLMFWRSFCLYEEKCNELMKLKGDTVRLAVTFYGPTLETLLDPIVGAPTCRIGVKNLHATKTARNVRVHLRNLDCDDWLNHEKPQLLYPITSPHDFVLPLANDEHCSIAYNVYPQTELVFDLLFVDYGLIETGQVLVGMSPFVPPQKPMINHPLSFHGFFPLLEVGAATGKTLKVFITVTCDDSETLEHTVDLRIPSVAEGPLPHFVKAVCEKEALGFGIKGTGKVG